MKKPFYPTAGEIIVLHISAIRPTCRRKAAFDSEDTLAELTDSIREYGLLEPLVVRLAAPETYDIVMGERRYKAAIAAGLTEIPCILLRCDAKENSLWRLVSHLHCRPPHYLDDAESISILLQSGMTAAEAAEKIHKPLRFVTDKLKLLSLSETACETIVQEKIPQETALLLSELPHDQQEALLRQYKKDNLSVSSFHQLLLEDQQKESRQAKIVIFKDVTVFTNTVEHAVSTMNKAGINAASVKTESAEAIEYRITIPKDAAKPPRTNIG